MSLPESLDEFVEGFRSVYGHIDGSRSEEALWLQVVEESSVMAEAVREIKYEQIFTGLPDLFVWLCGFVGKCNKESSSFCHFGEDFSSVIWLKFPHVCPRCNSNPCECLKRWRELLQREHDQKKQAYERIENKAKESLTGRIRSLDGLEAMFNEVFGNNILITDIKEITFHLLEEVGEVSEQIRELRSMSINKSDKDRINKVKQELRKELADVFSWMVALLIKVNYLSSNSIDAINALRKIIGQREVEQNLTMLHNRLLRSLVLKFYTQNEKIVCRTCKQTECDLALHSHIYQVTQPS